MKQYSNRHIFFFLSPALSAIFIFFFIPVIIAFILSFTDFDIYSLAEFSRLRFVGFTNYRILLADNIFWQALLNTFYFVFLATPLSIGASLSMALLINLRLLKFKSFFRLSFFIPVITTLVAVAIVWRFIYNPRFGLINYFLSLIHLPAVDWLGDPFWAMPAIILMSVWKSFGYNMIIFLAGLQSIPENLYEAANVEGASSWQTFRYVTLPMLRPTMVFVGLMTLIGSFQIFAEPYIMTQGGPLNKTLTIVQYMYESGFRWWRMGYSAALAFILFTIILLFTLVQLQIRKRLSA
jgi:multiple sugar transport system permease protein